MADATWTADEADVLDDAEAAIADYRVAMRRLLDASQPQAAAEIAAGLTQFWISRFLGWEGQRWLAECLAFEMDDETRLEVVAAASGVAFFVGRYDESAALSEEVLELAERRGDRRLQAQALYGIGRVDVHRRPAAGIARIERAIAIYEEVGDHIAAAECRVAIGIQAAYAGDRALADATLAEATTFLEASDYPRIASVGHRYLSLAAWHDDDEPAARAYLERAIALADRASDRRVRSGALAQRGLLEAKWGDMAVAANALIESITLTAGQHGIYFALSAFGALPLLIRGADWSMASRLLAHFDQVHRDYGWIPLDQRNAATAGYRAQVAAGLASSGERPDPSPVRTSAMAEALLERLRGIARA